MPNNEFFGRKFRARCSLGHDWTFEPATLEEYRLETRRCRGRIIARAVSVPVPGSGVTIASDVETACIAPLETVEADDPAPP